ncbi:MAG: DUF2378 family protein [Myxococcota bacterium]
MADEGFSTLPWDEPLDAAERIAAAPPTALVKGMFCTQIIDMAKERGVELQRPRYSAFRDYAFGEWLTLMEEAAARAFPKLSPRAAVAELARPTFPRFRDSLLGRVIFTVADFEGSLRLAAAAYRRVSIARCTVTTLRPGYAELELRNVWEFPAWQVGIYRGGFEAFGLEGTVRTRSHSLSALDLQLQWRDAPQGE